MKRIIYILLILLLSATILQAQDVLSSYLQLASDNNPALRASFNEYAATLEKIPQVGSLPDPQVTFGYFIVPVETKTGPQRAKLSITQMFPWFGSLKAKENIWVSVAKAKYEVFWEKRAMLFFDVRTAYYDLYFVSRSIDITRETLALLKKLKRLALIKIEAGKASGVDALRIEMEINELENSLVFLNERLHALEVKFGNMLNSKLNGRVILPGTLWEDDVRYTRNSIIDSITLNNHMLRRLEHTRQKLAYDELFSRKQGAPNLLLGVDYSAIENTASGYNAGRDAFMVKIGFSIPLYRKKYSSKIKETRILQQVVENKKTDKVNSLLADFEMVYSRYVDASRRIMLYKKQWSIAERAMKLLENEYSVNGKNFEEVLRMERKTFEYALLLERARTDKQKAIARIYYLMGL